MYNCIHCRYNLHVGFTTLYYSICLLLFTAFFISATPVKAQNLPAGFSQVLVANGISNPTNMTFAPDGRLFVAQQTGQLRIIKNGALLTQPFIMLTVNSSGERGLLGIAFDPAFNTNHFIYLYYTLSSGANNRISRFTANGDIVVPGSEVVVLNLDPLSSATNHNGGSIHFGTDGKLYVAAGENANSANSQNLDTYLGKILRINPDGSVPAGNPFTTGTEQRKRVWEYGMRNPFTFEVQPVTGRIFVNDVGQNTWEEVNDCTTGGHNYGWPNAEGINSNSQYTNPVYTYGHGSGIGVGCAINGGTFFNPASTNYPSSYIGKYFFLDYCGNWIDMLTLSGSTATRANFASSIAGSPVSMATGTDGNLYFLSRSNSAVYKITYTTSSAPVITNQPQSITVAQGNSASFSVTATGTPPLSYQWKKNNVNISGATNSTYNISSVTTSNAGTYSVTVSNASGNVTSNNATLTVTGTNQLPNATIITPASGATYAGADIINFSGSGNDPEDGTLSASAFNWFVIFHHDSHTHPGPTVPTGVKSGLFTIPNTGETAATVFYRLYLVVTDSKGAKDTSFTDILPRTSTITLNTSPQGLQVTLDGQPFTAPVTVTSVEGILRTIGAITPQGNYTFSNWSQGGNATQTITTPVNNTTYTANYSSATSLTLLPVADAYVRSGSYANTNYGSSAILYSKQTSTAEYLREVYIRFDISSITAGISSARLRLYGYLNSTENPSVPVEIHSVTNVSWLENSITWNNKPATQTTVLATKTITGTAKQYYEWDITQHIISLRNSGINFVTLKLLNTSTTLSRVEYNSKEATANKPQLVVLQSSAGRPANNVNISVPGMLSNEINFSIYPNPAKGNFDIVINNYSGISKVRIHDLNGRLVREHFTKIDDLQKVHISNLKTGMYIVSVENGKNIKSKEITIEK